MIINWGALGTVAAVSLVVGVVIVALTAFALVGLSAREPGPTDEPGADGMVVSREHRALSSVTGTVIAAICLPLTTAIVLYGLYIIAF
jgi:hypothetical protein